VDKSSKIKIGDVNPEGILKIKVDLNLVAPGLNKQIHEISVTRHHKKHKLIDLD